MHNNNTCSITGTQISLPDRWWLTVKLSNKTNAHRLTDLQQHLSQRDQSVTSRVAWLPRARPLLHPYWITNIQATLLLIRYMYDRWFVSKLTSQTVQYTCCCCCCCVYLWPIKNIGGGSSLYTAAITCATSLQQRKKKNSTKSLVSIIQQLIIIVQSFNVDILPQSNDWTPSSRCPPIPNHHYYPTWQERRQTFRHRSLCTCHRGPEGPLPRSGSQQGAPTSSASAKQKPPCL